MNVKFLIFIMSCIVEIQLSNLIHLNQISIQSNSIMTIFKGPIKSDPNFVVSEYMSTFVDKEKIKDKN